MNGFGTYDAASHNLVIAGNVIDGFADGTAISIVRDTNITTDKAGIMGDVVVSEMHDQRATCTVVLQASSRSNDVLSAMAKSRVKGAFLLNDALGTTKVRSAWCWVQKFPDVAVEAESPARTWEIRIAHADVFVGSTPSPVTGG